VPASIRVLLVEDNPDDAELIVRRLKRGGYAPEARRVEDAAGMRAALAAQEWDVVIADHALPRFDAPAALGVLRAAGIDLPFIIVSGQIGEDAAVAAMKAGAHDYVMKNRLARLAPAVEREIRESVNRREQRRSEAALQAVQEQFRQSQKMESIGRLAGGIAHDFNNLLTVIIGYAERMLADLAPDSPRREGTEAIVRTAERAATLTSYLLAFSRRQILIYRVHDLNQVVRGVETLLQRIIGEDVTLVVHAHPDLWGVRADEGQIEQVLLNLAVNARDAMPEGGTLSIATGGVRLTEAVEPALAPGDYVTLSVSDTGQGIDPAIQSQIFEPFFTTKPVGKGTGLGLSMVYGAVVQSGGHITVTSGPGRGATFTILLPRWTAAPPGAATIPRARAFPGGHKTILVVEDHDDVRQLILETLAGGAYTVLEARNGQAALALCESLNEPLDLLVTDVVMPVLGGLELARQVTRRRPGLKVLFLSGYAETDDLNTSLLEPGTAFLAKPFTSSTLLAHVRDLLKQP
jgi:signal transduction histidine kinase